LFKTLFLEDIGAIRTKDLEQFLNHASMPYSSFEGKLESPKYAVKFYKVTYQSSIPEQNNIPLITTGLIAIPDSEIRELPLISYQHGTIFNEVGLLQPMKWLFKCILWFLNLLHMDMY